MAVLATAMDSKMALVWPGQPKEPAERSSFYFAALIGALVVILFVAVASVGAYDERRHILGETRRSTANLARTLEEHTRLTLGAVLHSLESAANYMTTTAGARNPGNPATREVLRQIVDAVPYLSDIKVTDRNGILIADVQDTGIIGKDFSFKSTYQKLRDNPELRFVLSKAEKSEKYGGWVIFVVARLEDARGQFDGVAVGALDVSHFNQFYEAINVGRAGAIKLVREDGTILTRRPEGFIGQSVAKGPLFAEHLPNKPVDTVEVAAATDGLRRILSYRAVSGFPVVVVVSASKAEVLAGWLHRVKLLAFLGAGIALPIVVLLALLWRSHRRQTAATADRRRIEARFLNAIEHIEEGVAVYDADDRLVISNSTFRANWKENADRIVPGRSFESIVREGVERGILAAPDGDERDKDQWLARRLARHRQSGEPFDWIANGRWRRVREYELPDGGTLMISADITDIKERERQNREAMEAAKQADAAKTRFLEAANHDLRQPLQALSLMCYALAQRSEGAPVGDITKNMRHAIESMEAVLNGLKDIGDLETGRIRPRESDFGLRGLFERMRAEFFLQAEANAIDFRIVPTTAVVRSDPDLLGRIIENFLSNAVRYTEYGRVLLGARRNEDKVRIEVWDTGPGIPPDEIEKVFEEFYQLGNPPRDRSRGIGLGLSIVDRIAKLLDIPLDVRSEAGKGSMFAVIVAAGDADRVAVDKGAGTASGGRLSNSILVVDDDLAVLEATRIMLEALGARVECAPTAREALALVLAKGRAPDLVLSDHRLPEGQTGVELLQRIRQIAGRAVPGVIITGDTNEANLRQAEKAGFPVLRKPVDPQRLRQFVDPAPTA